MLKRINTQSVLHMSGKEHTNRRKALTSVFHYNFLQLNVIPRVKTICDETFERVSKDKESFEIDLLEEA